MRSRTLITTIVVGLVLGSLGVVLLRQVATDGDSRDDSATSADLTSSAATSAAPSPSTAASPSAPAPTGTGIETTSDFYFGRPYETIPIPGRYRGVEGPTKLRVQLLQPDGWQSFPLPTVTRESGYFRAHVELGAGQYRLRLVDPATGTRSRTLTLLLF